MKNIRSIKSCIALLVLCLCGCEKNFNVGEASPQMVVSCWFDNQNIFHVFVTQTSTITGNTQLLALQNAQVQLYRNDSLLAVLPYVAADSANVFGDYESTFFPAPGNRYSVKVYQSNYGTASASDTILTVVPIQQYSLSRISDSLNYSNVYFSITFQDNGSTQDYYRLKTWVQGSEWVFRGANDSVLENYAAGSPPQLLTPLSDTVRDVDLLFSDAGFNGQSKQINFWFAIPDTAHFQHLNISVQLHHASAAQYQYQSSLALQRAANSNNPVNVYSNVSNGYGIFMSSAIYSVMVPVK